MKPITRISLLLLVASISLSVQFKAELRTMFGVRVAYQATGEMVTLVAFFSDGTMQSNRKFLSREQFIQYASGNWPSIYNRNRVDLFKLNEVEGGVFHDSISGKKIPYCFALDELWKLRYKNDPFKGSNAQGWSQEMFTPSKGQQLYLQKNYGMENINVKFIIDTNFWKLLRDVQDSAWIENYMNIPFVE